jgi:hypothetical protein
MPPLARDRPLQKGGDVFVDIPGQRRGRLLHSLETRRVETPDKPIARTSPPTRRVETPPIQASWITLTNAFPAVLRGSRNGGKHEPWRSLGCAGSAGRGGCRECDRGWCSV